MGETSWFLKKRLYEHQQLQLKNDASYAPIVRRYKEGHHFDLKGAKFIQYIYNK